MIMVMEIMRLFLYTQFGKSVKGIRLLMSKVMLYKLATIERDREVRILYLMVFWKTLKALKIKNMN